MRTLITAAVVYLALPFALMAQKRYNHEFPVDKRARVRTVFSYVRVVDGGNNIGDMGYARDKNGSILQLTAKPDVAAALSNYGTNIFKDGEKTNDTLLVVLKSMTLEHNPANTQMGTIYIRGDFFQGGNDAYQLLFDVDSFYEVLPGRLPQSMLIRFDELLFSYFEKAANSSATAYTYTFDGAVKRIENERLSYPLYRADTFVTGIYTTFEEFLQQKPSITQYIKADRMVSDVNLPYFYMLNKKGKAGERITEKEFYAAYEKRWYKTIPDKLAVMKKINDEFYIEYFIPYPQQGGVIAVPGTLVGAAVVATYFIIKTSIEASRDKTIPSDISRGPSAGGYLLRLDYKTGHFIPVKKIKIKGAY